MLTMYYTMMTIYVFSFLFSREFVIFSILLFKKITDLRRSDKLLKDTQMKLLPIGVDPSAESGYLLTVLQVLPLC